MKTLSQYIIQESDNFNFKETIKNLPNNKSFISSFYDSKLSRLNDINKIRLSLIDNRCQQVADYFSKFNDDNIEFYFLGMGTEAFHVFMKYDNKYYDAYNYEGVSKLSDLEFVKMYLFYLDESELQKNLTFISKGTFDWSKYKEINNKSKELFDKYQNEFKKELTSNLLDLIHKHNDGYTRPYSFTIKDCIDEFIKKYFDKAGYFNN